MRPELIVMLTHNDRTVENAADIFEQCRNTPAVQWGFKEVGLPPEEMKSLFSYMKSLGKRTFLEVVCYTEQEGLDGAKLAAMCGVDVLMGTMYFDSIHAYCREHQLKYMPFVGKISGRPSVLEGSVSDMIHEANSLAAKGVYGFDLLGYRYTGDAAALNRAFVRQVDRPVCLAGSIASYERLDEVIEAAPWAFTIGGAFFENKFNGSFAEQIEKVIAYINRDM